MAFSWISWRTFCDGGMNAMLTAAMTPRAAIEVSFLEMGRGMDFGDRLTMVAAACFLWSS